MPRYRSDSSITKEVSSYLHTTANIGGKINMGKTEKAWWQMLDWSTMRLTFEKHTSKSMQEIILKEGYWSLGSGVFEKMDANTSSG